VLREFDQEICRGEQARVGPEERIVLRAIQDTRGVFFHEHFVERHGRASAWRVLEEVAGIFTERSTLKPLYVQSSIFLASRSLMSFRFRKKPTTVERLSQGFALLAAQGSTD
jgi:hypothetical protein